METSPDEISIRDIVSLCKNGMLKANSEYQRGLVWKPSQKKKLIDSVMRGYSLPLIFLHHIKKKVGTMQREDLEIIDGQQRINSLYEFAEGAFKLFDPVKDDKVAKFPGFIKRQACPWGGKDISALPDDLKTKFFDTVLRVTKIETDDANEVRDLFVRLQSGLPLNAQEARDAWPGDFTDFILWLGGKPEIPRYPGHGFFQGPMGMKPGSNSDRGKTRQTAAQIAMLFLHQRDNGRDAFLDINATAISDFYHSHIDFDRSSPNAQRLVDILDKLNTLLLVGKRPKLKAHDAIHLVLLVDTLWDDYTRSWETSLPKALDQFFAALANAKAGKDEAIPDEFWLRYGQWTRVNSDRADTIARRHAFYAEKMLSYLQPLQLKDPKRLFGELEREVLFYKRQKNCDVCDAQVSWNEAEVHHIIEHSKGGPTDLNNGALVHQACHPKSAAATAALAEKLKKKQEKSLEALS